MVVVYKYTTKHRYMNVKKATTVTISHLPKLLYYLPIHKPHGNVWFTWFGIMKDLQDTEDVERDLQFFTRLFSIMPSR